jgi:quercetin dioxygenase-like cupin family protein
VARKQKTAMDPVPLDAFVQFRDEEFYANKVHDSEEMRVVAFCFKPGQEMDAVTVKPAVLLFAYSGEGFFTVGKRDHPVEPGKFVVVAPGEAHGLRAGKLEPFVVLVVIAPSPTGMLE